MTLQELTAQKRDEIRRIAARHGARNVRLFGSMVRGDAGPTSDVDLLVEAGPEASSWFPAGMVLELEELLGRRVEVVTDRGLNPDLRESVLREAIPV